MVVHFENQSELHEAHYALFASGAPTGGWIICNYIGPDTIRMVAAGPDGPEGLARQFRDNQIQYALIRIDVPNPQGKQEPRDVFVTWTGRDVGIIEKGKKSWHQDSVSTEMPGHNARVRAEDVKRFNLEKQAVAFAIVFGLEFFRRSDANTWTACVPL